MKKNYVEFQNFVTQLVMDGCQFKFCPEILYLKNLKFLSISWSSLSEWPIDLRYVVESFFLFIMLLCYFFFFFRLSFAFVFSLCSPLTKMQHLRFATNVFTTLPAWITAFPDLKALDFYSNKFKEVPSVVWQLRKLETFDFRSNPLLSGPNMSNFDSLVCLFPSFAIAFACLFVYFFVCLFVCLFVYLFHEYCTRSRLDCNDASDEKEDSRRIDENCP
jgi:hypothetical protein